MGKNQWNGKLVRKIINSKHTPLVVGQGKGEPNVYINANALIVAFSELEQEHQANKELNNLFNELCVAFQVVKGDFLPKKLYEGRSL